MTIGLQAIGYKSQGSPFYGQICIGETEVASGCFINLFKATSLVSFGSNATPANLDSTGYPVSTFSDVILFQFYGTPPSTGPYIMSWPAGRSKFKIVFFGITATSTAHTNCTIQNDGGNNWGVTGDGTNAGSVTFSFASVGANMQFYFDGNGGAQAYAPGSGDMTLMRTSDVTAFNQGEIFAPALITDLQALSPKILRMMPVINIGASNLNSEVKWKYRTTPQHFSWRSSLYNPTNYAGVITAAGAGTYPLSADQWTAPAASDSPLTGWVDKEVFVAKIPTPAITQLNVIGVVSGTAGNCKVQFSQSTANMAVGQQIAFTGTGGTTELDGIRTIVSVDDSSHVTVNVTFVNAWSSNGSNSASTIRISMTGKSGGAKFIVNQTGGQDYGNGRSGLTMFTYDATLDRVIFTDPIGQLPVEIQCALANKLNCDMWANIPYLAEPDFVAQWATAVRDNLRPAAVFYPEYSNEMDFNFAFPQTAYAFNAGAVLGFPSRHRDFLAYKIKKYLGEIVGPVWAGRSNQLRRVMALQYVPSNTDTTIWKGANLSSFGYNVSPSRPIDVVECIAYAPYAGGRNLSGGADINFSATAKQTSWYQTLVNTWDGGSTAAAIAIVDDDIRQGRCTVQNVTASGTTFTTPLAHGFTATQTCLQFQVTGGTTYSGVATNKTYRVLTTPTSTTFTMQDVALSTINAGSAGSGTTTVGDAGVSFNGSFQICWTILGFANTVTPFWEALATGFDSDRPAGMLPLKVCWYEGALEAVCPDVTGLGLTGTNPTASINAAILAWRNSTSARDTYIAYCRQFMGTDATQVSYKTSNNHALSTSNLSFGYSGSGTDQYALLTGGPGSSRFKTFDGFASFSVNG